MSRKHDKELLTANGETKTMLQWALSLNINSDTLWRRMHYQGMTPDDAVSTKRHDNSAVGKRGRKALKKKGFNTELGLFVK